MAGVNVKMGVSGVSEFKRGMNDAKSAVKTFDEELKLNAAQLKLNGNQELYMSNQAKILKDQIEAQKKVVQEAEKALKSMEQNGVSKSSASYQKMYQEVLKSSTKLQEMKTDLKNVETGASGAAKETEVMNTSLKEIGKGVAWDNVAEGIGKVTSALQSGARAAINLGKKIVQSATGSTGWADDILTRSSQYEITPEELQRMEKLSEFIDTDVDAILTAKQRMSKATTTKGGVGAIEGILGIDLNGKNATDLFWEVGDALMRLGDEFDKEGAAQQIFGRSWRELVPLFKTGRAEYEKALGEQNVLTDDQVKKLGEADDAFKKLQQQVELMKNQFWADNADKITELLGWIIDNKEGVVAGITAIGAAFGTLKIAELAANMGKTIDGFRQLGLLGGGKAAASAAGAGTSAAGGGGLWGLIKGIGVKAGSFLSAGGGTLLGVLGAGLLPGILANNSAYANSNATLARRLGTAGGSNSMEAMFLAQAAQALNIDWGKNQDYSTIEKMLMGMNSRSGIEKSKLHNLLNGSTTSQGNYTWNELQRLWGGEAMDAGRLVAIMESVADAYERLVATQEQQNGDSQTQQNTLTSADIAAFTGLPGQIAQAVRAGVSGITITISQGAVDTIGQRNGQTMWQNIINKITGQG